MSTSSTDSDAKRGGGRRWPRRLAWVVGGLLALVVIVVATADFWVPRAAEAWLGGTSFTRREVRPGKTVTWTDLAWANEDLRLEAGHVRVSSPWGLLREGRLNAQVRDWELTVRKGGERGSGPGNETGKPEPGGAWEKWVPALRELGRRMERRVGEVELREGVVRVGEEEVAVDRVLVEGGVVRATLRAQGRTLALEADLAEAKAAALWEEGGVRVDATLRAESGRAELRWAGNTATAEADFVEGSWMPGDLVVKGENWRVPAERLGLGAAYEDLRGGFELRREGEGLAGAVNAVARPRGEGLPAVQIVASGAGGMDWARVERVEIEAPQARARLSAPLEWRRGEGWSGEGEPVFAWEADLGALSEGEVEGRVAGSARWLLDAPEWRVRWAATGVGLAWREVADARLLVRGETGAARTTVTEAELVAADGSRVEASGTIAHAERRIEAAELRASLKGGLLRPWLPEGASFEGAELDARAAGAWTSPELQGRLRARGAEFSGWAAETFELRVEGRPDETLRAELQAGRGGAELSARAEIGREEATIESFVLRDAEQGELRTTEPARLRWAGEGRRLKLELAGGGGARVSVDWSEGSATEARVDELTTGWARAWRVSDDVPELVVHRAEAKGRIGPGPEKVVTGNGAFDLEWVGERGRVWARGAGALGPEGARLDSLVAGRGEAVLVEGAGQIPWRVRGGTEPGLAPVEGGRWDFRLESRAGAEWWDELAKAAKLSLEEPTLDLRVEGAAAAPSGRLDLAIRRLRLHGEELPEGGLELRGLRAEVAVMRDEIVLRRLEAEVDGQRVEAEGRVPVASGAWERAKERPVAWLLEQAEARVSVPEAEVAALARYLPTVLAPQGTLSAELRAGPGRRVDGTVVLRGAATRPLGNFGVLQDVEVSLALSGMDVRIETMRASAGGQELRVTGGARRIPGRMPALDLAVKAERFPLVRKPGLLLRGDLDLTVKTGEAGRTTLGGEVRLRDSLFLADIRPLLTPGGRGAAAAPTRPPYFSVATPPLADWELGLRVGGEEFLRLRTPIFEGTGSARFDLAGTLREPRAVGEFWIERGNILFPFASFAVQEGAVRLRASDPYTPALDFRATGRRLGYELRLELTGTAESPQLQLSSSPPLEPETLLLMVTAGAAPADGPGAASGTQRLAAVGAYVGRDLLRTLGLGGTDEERLTVSSGEKVSRQGRETYEFEFKLNDKWSLTGEYDEFDAYNVGVKRGFGPGAREERARAKRPETEENNEP